MKRPEPFDTIQSIYHPDQNPYIVVARDDGADYFSVIAFGENGRMRVLHDYEIEGFES